jgi:uncharacterized protein YggU (UPF0235/DUF167 family)
MNNAREPWRAAAEGIVVVCRLTPKAARDALDGVGAMSDGSQVLLARVRAPPEDGRANKALCDLIAGALGMTSSAVSLARGGKSRVKQIAVRDDSETLIARLAAQFAQ